MERKKSKILFIIKNKALDDQPICQKIDLNITVLLTWRNKENACAYLKTLPNNDNFYIDEVDQKYCENLSGQFLKANITMKLKIMDHLQTSSQM